MSEELLVEARDGVLLMTINRPDQRNAMTLAVADAIAESLDMLDERTDLSVGILTGAGRDFCAGMDLKRFAAGERPYVPGSGFGGITERVTAKPLIAAVEGWALGGGFEIALACDLIIAGESARFGLPEVKRGLVARGGGIFRLPQRIPRAIALEALLIGDPLSSAAATQHGLVNRVVPDGEALGEAQRLASGSLPTLRSPCERARRSRSPRPTGRQVRGSCVSCQKPTWCSRLRMRGKARRPSSRSVLRPGPVSSR